MARSGGSRRRSGRRGRSGQQAGQGRQGPAIPRPTRGDAAPAAAGPDDAGAAEAAAVPQSNAAAESAGTLPARPRRQFQAERPTTEDAPRVRSLWYRLTHPRAIIAIIDELRKVVWPSRQETANLTVVVLVVAIAVGIFLGVIDFGLNRLVENALLP